MQLSVFHKRKNVRDDKNTSRGSFKSAVCMYFTQAMYYAISTLLPQNHTVFTLTLPTLADIWEANVLMPAPPPLPAHLSYILWS